MQIIPIQNVPAQQLNVSLGGQDCTIRIYQKDTGLYGDVFISGVLVIGGVVFRNSNRIIRDLYLAFLGDIMFIDLQGSSDPQYVKGQDLLGVRYKLVYLDLADLGQELSASGVPSTVPFTPPIPPAPPAPFASSIVLSVSTITDLRAVGNVVVLDNQVLFIEGYNVRNDKGGGMFFYNASDTTSSDDGILIIVDSFGRRWYRVQFGPVTPQQGGAFADGIADDTVAFQRAIGTTQSVYVPGSDYLVSALLELNTSNQAIFGDAGYKTRIKTSVNAAGLFYVSASAPTNSVTLRDLHLEGTSANEFGVKVGNNGTNYCSNLVMERIFINGFSATGKCGLQLAWVIESDFVDLRILNNYYGVHAPDIAGNVVGTCTFRGGATNIGRSVKSNILFEGPGSTVSFQNSIIDAAGEDGFRATAPVVNTGLENIFIFDTCYFEFNNGLGTGVADINVVGQAGDYLQTKVEAVACEFHTQTNPFDLYNFDHAVAYVERNDGLDMTKVTVTANVQSTWKYNSQIGNGAADTRAAYRTALAGSIFNVEDKDYNGQIYRYEGAGVLHMYQNSAPVSGDYLQGDRVWFVTSGLTAGGWMGMVCTVSGPPGTWKHFGAIEA